MIIDFKFKIGDLVYLVSDVQDYKNRFKNFISEEKPNYTTISDLEITLRKPHFLTILARHVEECYGGIQIFYNVRMFADGQSTATKFFEFELIQEEV